MEATEIFSKNDLEILKLPAKPRTWIYRSNISLYVIIQLYRDKNPIYNLTDLLEKKKKTAYDPVKYPIVFRLNTTVYVFREDFIQYSWKLKNTPQVNNL